MTVPELAGVTAVDVCAFLYSREDEAMGAVADNRALGHDVHGPYRTEAGWLEIIDLRSTFARVNTHISEYHHDQRT
jgi:hypothetical protein